MVSIEDPFDQDDWDGYRPFTAAVGEKARDEVTPSSPTRHPTRQKNHLVGRCRSLGMTY